MKSILFAIILLFVTIPGFGQKGLLVGLGTGLNNVWIVNQNTWGLPQMEYSIDFGYTYGGILGYHISENAGIQIEIRGAQQGQKYEDGQKVLLGDPTLYPTTREIDLKYIQVPILGKYIGKGDRMKFVGLFGIQIAALRSATQSYEREGDQNIIHAITTLMWGS